MSLRRTKQKTRKVNPMLKPKLSKSLKKSSGMLQNWSQQLQFTDNVALKEILKEAHEGLKDYNSNLLEASTIVDRLEKNEDLTEEEFEDALLELELINESIKSYYSQNASLKKRLQTLKWKGGKHRKNRKTTHKKTTKKRNMKK